MFDPVLINGRFLTQPVSGVQRYAHEIVRALGRLPDAARRYVLAAPPGAGRPPDSPIPVHVLRGVGGHLWEQTHLARAARGGRLLSLCGAGPVGHSRQLAVIHDAAVFRHPELFRPAYGVGHRLLGRRLARRARLATVSRFSQGELAEALNLPPDAIAVAPNGAEHVHDVVPDAAVLTELDLSRRPYFVAVGNQTPNKNLAVAVRALARITDPDLRLVVVGARLGQIAKTASLADDPRVLLAGRRTDAEVAALLRHAESLIFPSLYEGFGLPPLEAMAQGCPVIASDIAATREVCCDAALYFDPTDDAALADLMRRVMAGADPARRAAGIQRAAEYRWSRSARILDDLLASI